MARYGRMAGVFKDDKCILKYNMKVLLLYQYLNHTSTVKSLADHLCSLGVNIECLDLPTLHFVSGKKGKYRFLQRINGILMKIGRGRRILTTRLKCNYILNQIQDFDIIDIHSYDLFYNNIIPDIKKHGKALIIMVWGSDFYRATKEALERKRLGFAYADIIHLETESVRDDFIKVYPEFKSKIRVVPFGLDQLDRLKVSQESPLKEITLVSSEVYRNKLIVTCGYNGIKSQQHLLMIKAVLSLPDNIKSRLHLIVPFTYGGTEKYKKEVIDSLKNSGMPFTLLDKNLSEGEVTELRRISHIVLNIQITDSFSASLQEHMMAGSVLIVGDWLPYDVFDKAGLFTIKTSLEELTSKLFDVVSNYEEYAKKAKLNTEKIYNLSSWSIVANKWVEIYDESLS